MWDKIWKDKNGQVVLWQSPNFLLYGWAVFAVLDRLLHGIHLSNGLGFLATIFLLIWALLELISGVNYFRRGLGAIIFIWTITSLITKLF